MTWTNWAGNYAYRAARLHEPQTLDELRELVARSMKLKVLGTRHSFNDIADTTGDLVSLRHFDRVLALDVNTTRPTVTIEAGISYGHLCRHLNGAGYALHNLASLPHISVAGACATATHGSGDRHGTMAGAVVALDLVGPDGEIRSMSRARDPVAFDSAVVALGALGIVTALALRIEPAYEVRQDVYLNLPVAQLEAH